MKKQTILFLAADPLGTTPQALGEEAHAIQAELERSGYRDCFDLQTRWAERPLDLLRELRRLRPAIVHFVGHRGQRPIASEAGLFFQGEDGRPQLVTAGALQDTFGALSTPVQLVVLSACDSDPQAEALRGHVDCVVGMTGPIDDHAARSFAIGFYGGVGERESVETAFRQGCAAISLVGLSEHDRPRLRVRDGVDASRLVLAAEPVPTAGRAASAAPRPTREHPDRNGPSTNGTEGVFMNNPEHQEGKDFHATVIFAFIRGLRECADGPRIVSSLALLNAALRGVDSSAYVLSAIAGAIIVIPDDASWTVEATLAALGQARVDLPLRVGVTRGRVEVVRDIDDQMNVIGPALNIAARLATSPDNPGALFHDQYANWATRTLPPTHWLCSSADKALDIAGKRHDAPFRCFAALIAFDARPPEPHDEPAWQSTVLVAYDLPEFSAGDRSQLRKRFTRLVGVFRKLRQSAVFMSATTQLSPGGDGGVLVLGGVGLSDASAVSSRLQELAHAESVDHADRITVRTRIGLHYGRVAYYVNARGRQRPAGLDVFIADEIAGDSHARDRAGVVVTEDIPEALTNGTTEVIDQRFERLPDLPDGPAAGIARFVDRSTRPT